MHLGGGFGGLEREKADVDPSHELRLLLQRPTCCAVGASDCAAADPSKRWTSMSEAHEGPKNLIMSSCAAATSFLLKHLCDTFYHLGHTCVLVLSIRSLNVPRYVAIFADGGWQFVKRCQHEDGAAC